MRVCCVLDEAVQQEDHVILLEKIFSHDVKEFIDAIFQEVHFGLERIIVQEFVSNLRECLYHQLENVLSFVLDLLSVIR